MSTRSDGKSARKEKVGGWKTGQIWWIGLISLSGRECSKMGWISGEISSWYHHNKAGWPYFGGYLKATSTLWEKTEQVVTTRRFKDPKSFFYLQFSFSSSLKGLICLLLTHRRSVGAACRHTCTVCLHTAPTVIWELDRTASALHYGWWCLINTRMYTGRRSLLKPQTLKPFLESQMWDVTACVLEDVQSQL